MELISLNIVMANKKISEFPIASYPSPEDILLGDQGGATKAFTWGSLVQYFKDNFVPKSSVDFMPIGSIHYFAASTPPASFLVCNGSSLSRAEYSELFAVIGTTYGNVDSSHFNLPDLRGEFIRGWDNGRGIDSTRVFGSSQSDTLRPNLIADGSGIRHRNVALLPCIKATRLVSQLPVALNFITKPSNPSVGDVLTYNSNGTWISQTPNTSTPQVKAWVRWTETSAGFTSLIVGSNGSCGYNVSTITKATATAQKRILNFTNNIGNNYVIVTGKKEGATSDTFYGTNALETKYIDGNSCAIYAQTSNNPGTAPEEFHVAIIG
jgi:phage-related tail fiber protein